VVCLQIEVEANAWLPTIRKDKNGAQCAIGFPGQMTFCTLPGIGNEYFGGPQHIYQTQKAMSR